MHFDSGYVGRLGDVEHLAGEGPERKAEVERDETLPPRRRDFTSRVITRKVQPTSDRYDELTELQSVWRLPSFPNGRTDPCSPPRR